MRVLRSETHACCFASMRDAQCGSSEESPGSGCWEADMEWDGETVLVSWDRF